MRASTLRTGRWTRLAVGRTLSLTLLLGSGACSKPPPPAPPPTKAQTPVTSTPRENVEYVGPSFVLRGAKVMTAAGVTYEKADVYVKNGRIEAVGVDLEVPANIEARDVTGMVVTPGIIDTHSHMGVYPSPGLRATSDGNEIVGPNTAYVRAEDGVWPQDPQFETARAGGVTTVQVLPGSANLIGGRSVTIKLRPGARSVHDLKFEGAPYGLKMACGENPKRVYGEKGGPYTRMGNVAGYRKAFQAAVEYDRKWKRFEKAKAEYAKKKPNLKDPFDERGGSSNGNGDGKRGKGGDNKPPEPPGRDYGLETLAGVLKGEILVHNHCYRADEMSIMLKLAEEFGFTIRNFHHAVEAYKIADRLADAGTGASVWADWWGFKAEAYDGVKENAALITKAGARAILHSDSATGVQRLNQEAAKAMYAGQRAGIDITEEDALAWVTTNPAWSLGIEDQTGSLEPGKMADIAVWDRSPFSVYSKAMQVYIDGETVFDRTNPDAQPRTDFGLGHRAGDIWRKK